MKIDFFTTWQHYADHIIPIWKKLGSHAGRFLVPVPMGAYLRDRGIEPTILEPNVQNHFNNVTPHGHDPIVVAGLHDLINVATTNVERDAILSEHGVGLVFPGNASYAGNIGYRAFPSLTLAPNRIIYEKTKKVLPQMDQEIIGTPKLDKWNDWWTNLNLPLGPKPKVALSFHWDAQAIAPEAGTAFDFYRAWMQNLVFYDKIEWLAHGHPRAVGKYKPWFEQHGFRWIDDFEEVMKEADLYVNDCSSTMYEFLVTGKPVVILNSPDFRRDVDFGIRFWDYTDIGYHVNKGDELLPVIRATLEHPDRHRKERLAAIDDLYPNLGKSAEIAAEAILRRFV